MHSCSNQVPNTGSKAPKLNKKKTKKGKCCMYAILGSRGREAKDNTQNLEAGFITKTLVQVLYFQWTLSSYQAFKCLSCYKASPDPKAFDEAAFVKTNVMPSFMYRSLKLTPGLPRQLSSKKKKKPHLQSRRCRFSSWAEEIPQREKKKKNGN